MINQTCDCKHVLHSIGRPPDFLTILPNPPPLPPNFIDDLNQLTNNSLFENNNAKLDQYNRLKCMTSTTNLTNINQLITNDSNEQSMYIFVTIIVFIALIIVLVLFILFAFVYVYLNRLKLTNKKTTPNDQKQKIDVSVNVLPFHQYGQQSRSESSPSSTQSNLTSVLFNESDSIITNNNKNKPNLIHHFNQMNLKHHLIDSTTSSSYCSQTGLILPPNIRGTKRNDIFNSSSSSSSSSSGGFISSNSFNTNTKQVVASERSNILMYVPQQQNDNHQYESITDLSQYYFDINDDLNVNNNNNKIKNHVNTFQTSHLLDLSNNNLFRQQQLHQLQQFQIKQQPFLNSLIV